MDDTRYELDADIGIVLIDRDAGAEVHVGSIRIRTCVIVAAARSDVRRINTPGIRARDLKSPVPDVTALDVEHVIVMRVQPVEDWVLSRVGPDDDWTPGASAYRAYPRERPSARVGIPVRATPEVDRVSASNAMTRREGIGQAPRTPDGSTATTSGGSIPRVPRIEYRGDTE